MQSYKAQIQKFRFTLRFKEPAHLPIFLGATLRGGFGYAFRQVACALTRQNCETCLLRDRCAYAYVFETPPPPDAAMMRLYPSAPHPFVLEPPPQSPRELQAGQKLDVNLLLIGQAIEYLPYFVYAFSLLGEKGLGRDRASFDVESLHGVPPKGEHVPLYDTEKGKLAPFDEGWEMEIPGTSREKVERLCLRLETPIRIKKDGTITQKLDFHELLRNLLRRISALLYFHCGQNMADFDFKGWIEKAEKIQTLNSRFTKQEMQRYSTRQKQKMTFDGLLGEVEYGGELADFLPFLEFGEIFHAGKNTSFGFGKYQIVKPKENPREVNHEEQ